MIVSKLKGGLGNQMFQYALGRVLSLKNNVTLGLDISFYKVAVNPKRSFDLPVYNISGKILSDKETPFIYRESKIKIMNNLLKVFRKFFLRNKGIEKSFSFDSSVFSLGPNAYLDGYWQSPKYLAGFEDVVRGDFTLKNPPAENIKILAEEIANTSSLCIHVRRGDYVGNKAHEVVHDDYYQRGVEKISSLTKIEKIYVFSDDIAWCSNNLSFNFSTIFVDDSYAGERGEGHMYLMSKCKNFIIANSSFSWWAAWLSDYQNKIVICPKQWFPNAKIDTNDLIPKEWVRI